MIFNQVKSKKAKTDKLCNFLSLAYDPPIKISLCVTAFCSHPPHLSLGWAYRTPKAIGAQRRPQNNQRYP